MTAQERIKILTNALQEKKKEIKRLRKLLDEKDCGLKCPVTEGGKDEKEKKVTLSQNNKP